MKYSKPLKLSMKIVLINFSFLREKKQRQTSHTVFLESGLVLLGSNLIYKLGLGIKEANCFIDLKARDSFWESRSLLQYGQFIGKL